MNRALFNNGLGNEEFANLPRKINVCISPTRDDFPHTQVGRVGLSALAVAIMSLSFDLWRQV